MSVLNVTGQLALNYSLNEPLVLSTQTFNASPGCVVTYPIANGLVAVADAFDLHYEEVRTLAASASHTYILSALTDLLPRTIPFTNIHTVIIRTISRTAGDHLTHGPGGTHGWTPLVASGTQSLYGLFVFHADKTDSLAVSSGSNDQYVIANAGSAPITYGLFLGGNSG